MKRSWKTPNELVTLKRARTTPSSSCTVNEVDYPISHDHVVLTVPRAEVKSVYEGVLADCCDWCLKSKIRINSKQELAWSDESKPYLEAKAFATLGNIESATTLDEYVVLFHQSRIVWIHPQFPAIDLFPRMDTKVSTTPQKTFTLCEKEASVVKDHWSTSFHSVLQQLQYGHCPYFYVCADSWTILFMSQQLVKPHGLALLTPTTSGFRDVMKKQGITYEMPLVQTVKSEHEDLEGADKWLKSMIDTQVSFVNPEMAKNLAATLVSVQGTEFHGLVNFILNNKTLVSHDGRFAGIPPTLLAPTQFLGATMFALKVKRSKVKASNESGKLVDKHCLDLSGPILPHTVQLLKHILDSTEGTSIHYHQLNTTSIFNNYFQLKH